MNLVTATLKSDNTVYAQLDADLGPDTVRQTAHDMGITSPLHGYPAEGLGGLTNGVSPLEMARAYATIANGGYRVQADRRPQGHLPRRPRRRPRQAEPHQGLQRRRDLRGDADPREERAGAAPAPRPQIGCPAAGKTGTVDNFTDAWFVGFTPRLATSVWVGHPKDPYPLGPNAPGGTIAAPIWGAYMKSARGKFCGDFPQAEGAVLGRSRSSASTRAPAAAAPAAIGTATSRRPRHDGRAPGSRRASGTGDGNGQGTGKRRRRSTRPTPTRRRRSRRRTPQQPPATAAPAGARRRPPQGADRQRLHPADPAWYGPAWHGQGREGRVRGRGHRGPAERDVPREARQRPRGPRPRRRQDAPLPHPHPARATASASSCRPTTSTARASSTATGRRGRP